MMGNDDIHQIYDKVSREIEQHLAAFQAAVPSAQQTAAIRTLLDYVLHARQSVRDMNPAMALVQRAVEGLLDGFTVPATGPEQELMLRYRDCHLLIIRALQDPRVHGLQWTNKHVTRYSLPILCYTITITMRVFSAPCTRNRTRRHYNIIECV